MMPVIKLNDDHAFESTISTSSRLCKGVGVANLRYSPSFYTYFGTCFYIFAIQPMLTVGSRIVKVLLYVLR